MYAIRSYYAGRLVDDDRAAVRDDRAGDATEQGAFARPVFADEGGLVALVEAERYLGK